MLGIRRTSILFGSSSPTVWTPTLLYTGARTGDWFDASDMSKLFSDTAGTTQAVANGTVARANWQRGMINATNATVAQQPLLRSSGGLYNLDFDGTDDRLLGTINLASATKMTVIAGVHKDSNSAPGAIFNQFAGSIPSWSLMSPETTFPYTGYSFGVRGTSATSSNEQTYAAPRTDVLVAQVNMSTPLLSLQVGNDAAQTSTTALGGNLGGSLAFGMGSRSDGGLWYFNGQLYAAIIVTDTLTSEELASARAWVASKSGVTL